MVKNNLVITTALYDIVEKSLSNKDTQKKYKDNIDKYLAANTDKYFSIGPSERPIYTKEHGDEYMRLCGLTRQQVANVIKSTSNIKDTWHIINDPTRISNALATRYSLIKKNDLMLQLTQWYLIVSLYPGIHFNYFKYGVNEACMQYTVMNLSNKYGLKNSKNLWGAFTNMMGPVLELHKSGIISGEDVEYVKYVQDVHVRMNSLVKNVAREYYSNYENQNFIQTEYENFDSDSYHEAESNSQDIERIANNVVNNLVINGPDMKLVQISAKSCNISVNELRTHMIALINSKHRDDIWTIVESILFLYLFNDDGESHSTRDIGTNEFMLYCLKMYKMSNTTNKNIIKIKAVLDKWMDDTGITKTTNRPGTILNYKKAFFTFFVLSIQKYGK